MFAVFSAITTILFKGNMRHNCGSHISLLFHESTKTTEPRHLGCCRVKLFLHGSSLHSVVVVYFVWWFWIVRRLSDHYKRRPFQFLCDKFLITLQFLCNFLQFQWDYFQLICNSFTIPLCRQARWSYLLANGNSCTVLVLDHLDNPTHHWTIPPIISLHRFK